MKNTVQKKSGHTCGMLNKLGQHPDLRFTGDTRKGASELCQVEREKNWRIAKHDRLSCLSYMNMFDSYEAIYQKLNHTWKG